MTFEVFFPSWWTLHQVKQCLVARGWRAQMLVHRMTGRQLWFQRLAVVETVD